MNESREKNALRVAAHTVIGNILLAVCKLAAGIFGHSAAMLSDAVHSLSDVLSTAIVMIGVKMAGKEADKEHPFGHERLESAAAIILAALLCATGLGIGYSGLRAVVGGHYENMPVPGLIALVAALVSIAVKEGMFHYTRAAAKKFDSDALLADAWHHRSDALSSIGSFAGILGARMGFPVLDSVAALVICLFIVKAACAIFRDAIAKMVDRSLDDETIQEIRMRTLLHKHVRSIDRLHTRLFGDKFYVELEISVDGDMTLYDAHAVAHDIHDRIEQDFPKVKHCMVHVNPCTRPYAAPAAGRSPGQAPEQAARPVQQRDL